MMTPSIELSMANSNTEPRKYCGNIHELVNNIAIALTFATEKPLSAKQFTKMSTLRHREYSIVE
jgi:hypothetical protein